MRNVACLWTSSTEMGATSGEPSAAPDSGSQAVQAGRVGRAHGLDGSFYVTGARPRLLSVGMTVRLAGRATVVVRRAGTDTHPIVRLEGIEDRDAAEDVRGAELTVDRSEAPSLEEGEWWASDLEGCEVLDGERLIGIVTRLVELPSCEALEVRRDSRKQEESRGEEPRGEEPRGEGSHGDLLIPMVREAIRRVDVKARRIDVDMDFLGETW